MKVIEERLGKNDEYEYCKTVEIHETEEEDIKIKKEKLPKIPRLDSLKWHLNNNIPIDYQNFNFKNSIIDKNPISKNIKISLKPINFKNITVTKPSINFQKKIFISKDKIFKAINNTEDINSNKFHQIGMILTNGNSNIPELISSNKDSGRTTLKNAFHLHITELSPRENISQNNKLLPFDQVKQNYNLYENNKLKRFPSITKENSLDERGRGTLEMKTEINNTHLIDNNESNSRNNQKLLLNQQISDLEQNNSKIINPFHANVLQFGKIKNQNYPKNISTRNVKKTFTFEKSNDKEILFSSRQKDPIPLANRILNFK